MNGAAPGPAPAAQPRASNSRLTRSSWRTWPQLKLRRKTPRVDVRLDGATEHARRPAGAQRSGVVDALAARERRGDQGQQFVAGVRPPRRVTEVEVAVGELLQTEMLGERGREEQPRIGHQAVVVEGRSGRGCLASNGCSLFLVGGFLQTPLSQIQRGTSLSLPQPDQPGVAGILGSPAACSRERCAQLRTMATPSRRVSSVDRGLTVQRKCPLAFDRCS